MLIEAGILLSAYVGKRLVEKYHQKALTVKKPKAEKYHQKALTVKKPKRALRNAPEPLVLVTKPTATQVLTPQPDKSSEHRFKISVLSFCVSCLRQFVTYPLLAVLNIGLYMYNFSYLREAEQALLHKRQIIDFNVMYAVIFVSCIAANQYLVAGVWDLFYFYAKKLKTKLEDQSKHQLMSAFEQQPHTAFVLIDNTEIEVPVEALKLNDLVVVSAGEVVPIDGVIVEGTAMVDQHMLTGESQPAEKEIGDYVFATTLVINGLIKARVEKAGKETTVAKVSHILNNTIDYKSTIQLKGEEWANKGLALQLGISGLALTTVNPTAALAILNSNFSYRLQMMAYLQSVNHMSLASRQGILIKDGRSVELLPQVDTILFDKTGTLTTDELTVGRIIVCSPYLEEELLTYAAAAERKLTHPIAKAILNKALASQLELPEVSDSDYKMGNGLTVRIEGKLIQLGSVRFMAHENIPIPARIQKAMDDSHTQGYSLVMVAIDNAVCGAIEIQPVLRPEIKQVLHHLRQKGIRYMAIVSGDHRQPTQALAQELGMDDYFYEVMPKDKAAIVEELQKQGHSVCFIGDGINDAIAMKKAQVSISLRGASAIATDVAHIILMDGSLSYLGKLFDIARQLDTRMKRSLVISITPTPIVIMGGLLFHFTIASAMVINSIALFGGIRYAMRIDTQSEDNV